ncbi:MAG: UDP-N-acetylglucosamine 2-epimerase [Phycisphaerales bacterium]|nr:MAG: UDP-N-acetylglucosamine 2-epimerase [Phycisphaerales bacterium]
MWTIHPVLREDGRSGAAARKTLTTLIQVNVQVVITYPNGDRSSDESVAEIEGTRNRAGFVVVKSLGRRQYIPLMKHAAAIVGNSSSGVVESTPLHLPAVDLGIRQEGRIHAANVLRSLLKNVTPPLVGDTRPRKTPPTRGGATIGCPGAPPCHIFTRPRPAHRSGTDGLLTGAAARLIRTHYLRPSEQGQSVTVNMVSAMTTVFSASIALIRTVIDSTVSIRFAG